MTPSAGSLIFPTTGFAPTFSLVPRPCDPDAGITASARHFIYDFHSSILPDDRKIVVYVPPAYPHIEEARFPVFYLHDGQNLFDGRTSYLAGRTWRAHATADGLTECGLIEPVILVGIYNTGQQRMVEYTPTPDAVLGGGKGPDYARLLVEEVRPFINTTFRTLPDRANTAVGGSSLGGLISLYLGFTYPSLFSKLAILSPSIWWDHRSILNLIRLTQPKPDLTIWLDMGTAEGARHLRDADQMESLLRRKGWRTGIDLAYLRAEGAVHDEDAWANRFDKVLQFLFPARPQRPPLRK